MLIVTVLSERIELLDSTKPSILSKAILFWRAQAGAITIAQWCGEWPQGEASMSKSIATNNLLTTDGKTPRKYFSFGNILAK